jgi:hypothetical protein
MFEDGRFFTPSGRARFIAIEESSLAESPGADFPFLLNTGRVRDQWHTMTRTGLSPKLASHMPNPFVEVNPDDASKLGLAEHGFARVSTGHGSAVLRVDVTAAQVPGRIFVPIHWNDETAARARWRPGPFLHRSVLGTAGLQEYSGGAGPCFFRRARFCSFARTGAAWWRHRLCMDRHRGRLCGTVCDQRAFRGFVQGPCREIARRRAGNIQRFRERYFSSGADPA